MASFVLKISKVLIKRFNLGEISARALTMSAAIFGSLLVFTGTKPFTEAEVLAIVNTYNHSRAAYKVGGLLSKPAFMNAQQALLNCILSFATYVDTIAKGDETILNLSTLPTNKPIDFAALIAAGATASGITGAVGGTLQLITNCTSFGTGVGYFAILSEGIPLPAGFTISSIGEVCIPQELTNRIFLNVTQTRRKVFSNLLPNKTYYLYYILMIGDVVGVISVGVPVGTGIA